MERSRAWYQFLERTRAKAEQRAIERTLVEDNEFYRNHPDPLPGANWASDTLLRHMGYEETPRNDRFSILRGWRFWR